MSQRTTEQERVIRLAEKLYRLAEGTPSEEEAESAIMKAQALLHDYDLTINDLSFFEKNTQCSQRGIILIDETLPGWVQTLVAVMVDVYDCRSLITRAADRYRRKIVIVGVEPNASIAEHSFLIAYRHLMTRKFPSRTTQKAKTEFRMGFTGGLFMRLLAEKNKNSAQIPGLVPIKRDLADKAFTELFPATRKMAKPRDTEMTQHYMHGVAEGQAFNIAAGVGSGTARQAAVGA